MRERKPKKEDLLYQISKYVNKNYSYSDRVVLIQE